jgi:hypothetical protein
LLDHAFSFDPISAEVSRGDTWVRPIVEEEES